MRQKTLKYFGLQSEFGVRRSDLNFVQLKSLVHEHLSTLTLHFPTAKFKANYADSAMIKQTEIRCYASLRKMIVIDGQRVPLTLQLLGLASQRFLGIKLTAYDMESMSEHGVFIRVQTQEWKKTFVSPQKKKSSKVEVDSLFDDYLLVSKVNQNAQKLLDRLKIDTTRKLSGASLTV